MKFLLDYVFPISSIEPTPAASTAFLKQACLVCKPKAGQEGNVGQIFSCTNMTAVGVRTNNTEAQQLFDGGLAKVYILLSNDLDLETALEANSNLFFTLLISSDFVDADFDGATFDPAESATITVNGDLIFTAPAGADGNDLSVELLDEVDDAGEEVVHFADDKITILMKTGASTAQMIKDAFDNSVEAQATGVTCEIVEGEEPDVQAAAADAPFTGGADSTGGELSLGDFDGVVGVSSTDDDFLEDQAAIANRNAFHTTSGNKAKNMLYAFGKMLSNALNWRNQQYITMPLGDDVDELGEANTLFDAKISFVLDDDEYGKRLGLFAAGGKAIVAPYIKRNLKIDMQSAALTYISGNQPAYTAKEAALVEDELRKVIDLYKTRGWIEEGTVEVLADAESGFTASGSINIASPKALWRVAGEMLETL